MNDETVYFTQYFKEIYPKDMYGVFEHSTGRLIAWCTTPEDAERLKALLIYHGDEFPRSILLARIDAETTQGRVMTDEELQRLRLTTNLP